MCEKRKIIQSKRTVTLQKYIHKEQIQLKLDQHQKSLLKLQKLNHITCSLEYEKDIMIHSDIFKNSEQNNFSLLNIENENFNKPNTNESLTNNENIIDKDLTDSMDKELIKCNLCGKSFKPKGININLNFCKKKHGF